MDERIKGFLDSLKKHLEGLSEQEINEAASYYQEYLTDACESGKDLDLILKELDTPERIAGMIFTESFIVKAQRSPGLKNFTSVLRNSFRIVTTPFAVFMLSIVVLVSFCMVVFLFAGAVSSFIAGVIIALGFVYEAFKIPFRYFSDIVGALGFGLIGAGTCLSIAHILFWCGKLFIRISTQLIRRILLQSGRHAPEMEKQEAVKKYNIRRVLISYLTIIVIGLALIAVSGLPVRYFTIFSSMKPEKITVRTYEYDASKINKLSITTAHSAIRIAEGKSDKIVLSYEQPEWLDYDIGNSGSMLSFCEKSNGKLPLFSLLSLHESKTELTVSVPKGFNPEIISLETKGGHIYISGLSANIRAKTFSNNIHLAVGTLIKDLNIKAITWKGDIFIGNEKSGVKTNEGIEYYKNIDAPKTIDLSSSNGTIYIN